MREIYVVRGSRIGRLVGVEARSIRFLGVEGVDIVFRVGYIVRLLVFWVVKSRRSLVIKNLR